MAHYPQSASGLAYITYPAGPTAQPLQVNASASGNTKGSYAELTSSSAFACNSVIVQVTRCATGGVQYLLDLATGPGGSETVVVPNITCSNHDNSSSHNGAVAFNLPLAIGASTRIAARCQCSTGSQAMFVALTLIAAGDTPGIASFTNYGAVTGDSGSTSVDPGGSANTKGSYTEITASTAAVVQALTVLFTFGSNTAPGNATWAVDLATGPGGSETVLIPDLRTASAIAGLSSGPRIRAYSVLTYIAATTRIAARASSSITDATDRLIEVALLAGTAP